jgi:hypothetical protein
LGVFLTPGSGIRDPGSGMEESQHPDPGSGIRDGKKSDPGSGIRDKHPGSATLLIIQSSLGTSIYQLSTTIASYDLGPIIKSCALERMKNRS